jgi:CBS domain-containing protein
MIDMLHILQRKGFNFFSVPVQATVGDALKVLAAEKIGLVLIMDGDALLGVFSERDAIRLAVAHGAFPTDRPIIEAMTSPVHYVPKHTGVDDCMALMVDKGIRHVPVLDGNRVVGVVSMRDVVLEAVEHRETIIRGLETYIIGGDYPPVGGR